jgi:uncharacterized protein (DUF1778 family)
MKDQTIQFKVSEEERIQMSKAAKVEFLNLSSFIRKTSLERAKEILFEKCFNNKINSPVPLEKIEMEEFLKDVPTG